jgi:hypothetical protein
VYTPSVVGLETAQANFSDTAGDNFSIQLTGSGAGPLLQATPIGFGTVVDGTPAQKTVTITNNGTGQADINTAPALTGGDGNFTLGAQTCDPNVLLPGQTCTVTINFEQPTLTTNGPESQTLHIVAQAGITLNVPVTVTDVTTPPMSFITPPVIDFGNVVVGSTSGTQTATVQNNGPTSITVGSISGVTGDFSILGSGSCHTGFVIASGGSCSIDMQYAPSTIGAQTTTLDVAQSETGGGPALPDLTVSVNGTGVAASASISQGTGPGGAIDFGTWTTGSESTPQDVTLYNNGLTAIHLGTANVSGEFAILPSDSDCKGTLAPGASCVEVVVFQPVIPSGTDSGALSVPVTGGTPLNVGLTGVGVEASFSVSPDYTFPPTPIDGVSTQVFTVTNTSGVDEVFNPAGTSGGAFQILTDKCQFGGFPPLVIPSGASCQIVVEFEPDATQPYSGELLISGGEGEQGPPFPLPLPTQIIPLFGTGIPDTTVTVSPNPLNFPTPLQFGSTSTDEYVTVTNTGTEPLVISATPIVGTDANDFKVDTANGCVIFGPIAPGASCTIAIHFTPQSSLGAGAVSATLGIVDNAASSPQNVALTATATAGPPGGALSANPASLDFGPVGVGVTSGELTTTITNNSSQAVVIGPVTRNNGEFSIQTDGCTVAGELDPHATCVEGVTFTPDANGAQSGDLVIGFQGGELDVPLSGNGVPPANTPDITWTGSPSALDFGQIAVGSTSNEELVTVKNTDPPGGNQLNVINVTTSGTDHNDFKIVSEGCVVFDPYGIAPGQTCTIGLDFAPTYNSNTNEDRTAQLNIFDNSNGAAQVVPLIGQAIGTAVSYTVNPSPSINFGNQALNTTSAPDLVTVANTASGGSSNFALEFPGSGDVMLTDLEGNTSTQFSYSNDLCNPLGQGSTIDPPEVGTNHTCTINVEFTPTQTGPQYAYLTFYPKNGSGFPQQVELIGNGVEPGSIGLSGGSGSSGGPDIAANGLNFGVVPITTTSPTQDVVITNTSTTAPLVISGISIVGVDPGDYAIVPLQGTCPVSPPTFSIAVGQSCTVAIDFTPSVVGTRQAVLDIVDNTPEGLDQVSLTGIGGPLVQGYYLTDAKGLVYTFGNAKYFGEIPTALTLNAPIVGIAATPDGGGYWLVASDGGIFSYGDAKFYGSTGGMHLNAPIIGITSTPDGGGYWLLASDGGIFSYGDATFYGSTGSLHLNKPVVAMTKTPDGGGYLLVASDGGVFAYGDAKFEGSLANYTLAKPINGLVESPDGNGYLMSASDGGVFAFGDGQYYGSANTLNLKAPVEGIESTPDFGGYWEFAQDGGVFSYGDAKFYTSTGGIVEPEIVGMAIEVLETPGG